MAHLLIQRGVVYDLWS